MGNVNKRKLLCEFILETLAQVGEMTLDGLFPKNLAEGRMWRRVLGLSDGYEFSRKNFSAALVRLRRQGLVKKSGERRWSSWLLSPKGRAKIGLNADFISIKPDGVPRLVMYDIPESDRKKRNWIRFCLLACGYESLQKSVWLGYSPLPESFLRSIREMKLAGAVHIVSIHKKGTLDIL